MSGPEQLYREAIRRHAAEPVGYGRAIQATHRHEAYNPLCGDRILLQLRVAGSVIEALSFEGEACAICLASASLLCAEMEGRPPTSLGRVHDQLERALNDSAAELEVEALEALLGVRPYPSRIQCAMLPWKAGVTALEAD
jgi:nitrogen fixation NifU-like protein